MNHAHCAQAAGHCWHRDTRVVQILQVALAALYLLLWTTPLRLLVTLNRPELALVGAPWAALGLLALFTVAQRITLRPPSPDVRGGGGSGRGTRPG